jgi:hypothetical protein
MNELEDLKRNFISIKQILENNLYQLYVDWPMTTDIYDDIRAQIENTFTKINYFILTQE